jgi:hypothetical protein
MKSLGTITYQQEVFDSVDIVKLLKFPLQRVPTTEPSLTVWILSSYLSIL